jgi:hypothetical protein
MRNGILAALVSPLLLAILPAVTRGDLLITLSDPNTSKTVMTIEMDSIDASSITSSSVLVTLLATPADYSKVTTFFPTSPSPLIVTAPFTSALGLPVTSLNGSTFTSDFSSGQDGQVYVASGFGSGGSAFQAFTSLSEIHLSTTTVDSISNSLTVSGTILDGTFADVSSVPEASTMVIAGLTLATYLAFTSVRRLACRRPAPTPE